MASPAIFSNFFEEQWTQNHPQYLSGLPRALFPTTILETAVCNISSMRLDSVFHLVMKHYVKCLIYFSNEMILNGEINNAKTSSFSSDIQTLIKHFNVQNFLCIFFVNY